MILLLTENTLVNYAEPTCEAKLLHVHEFVEQKKLAFFADQTPFHPVDYRWADQPGDKGKIVVGDTEFEVKECYMAALEKTSSTIYFDQDIPVKRGTEEWVFLVAHIIEDGQSTFSEINQKNGIIKLSIDQEYRNSLSIAHSACHLASLAMNKVTREYWKKTSFDQIDSLGHPNLDALTILESKIKPYQSIDIYRFGKTIRKKGLDSAKLIFDLKKIELEINLQLKCWLKSHPDIITSPFPVRVTDIRYWHCMLSEGEAIIPCGGTHVKNFSAQQEILITLSIRDEAEIVMNTTIIN